MERLDGMRVLVVEDEFLLALDISETLASEGANVIGPAGTLTEALDLVSDWPDLDYAVLDVNLRNEPTFQLATILQDRNVPFVFVTGYQAGVLPPEVRPTRVIGKPIDFARLVDHLADQLAEATRT